MPAETKKTVVPAGPVNLGDQLVVAQLRAAAEAGLLTDLAIFHNIDVVRQGEKLILPDKMSYDQGIKELVRRRDAEEKTVEIHHEIPCFPLDGVVALQTAFVEVYGHIDLKGNPGFWGPNPPKIIEIPVAGGGMVSAIISSLAPSLWEGGTLTPEVGQMNRLIITGEIKRKFEKQVKHILKRTAELLKEASIYRGQAISLNFQWQDDQRRFHPINDAPKFWQTEGITEQNVILNQETQFRLESSIYLRIERQADCERNGVPLKAGALFMGGYGTGKTLTAKLIASKCVAHGWTFIYLEKARWTAAALRVAELYAPCVLFAEDVESEATGERSEELNTLLNTLDGVDTKTAPIMAIFTSNHPEKISRAFLRAGRMDAVIPFDAPDEQAAARFVQFYSLDANGNSLLDPQADLPLIGKEIAGLNSSFISGIITQAKARAIYRSTPGSIPRISTEDIILAAKASRQHAAMVQDKPLQTPQDKVLEGLHQMGRALKGGISYVPAPAATGNGSDQ